MAIQIESYAGPLDHCQWCYWADGYVTEDDEWVAILGCAKDTPGEKRVLIELEKRSGYRSEFASERGLDAMERKWNQEFLKAKEKGLNILPPLKIAFKNDDGHWDQKWPEYWPEK